MDRNLDVVANPVSTARFSRDSWIYRHVDAIVVYGEHVKRYLESVKVPAEKVFVAPHAVDNSQYDRAMGDEEKLRLRTELRLGNAKTVLYLGRLEAIKGLDYLIRAFALLKRHDAILVIAGDGSLRQELEALARLLGVQHSTRFIGYVDPKSHFHTMLLLMSSCYPP